MNSARMVGLRLYLCASGILAALYSLIGTSVAFVGVDPKTEVAVASFLLATCTLGVLDTLINDVLGEPWKLEWTEGWRHDGYIVLAVANLAIIFAAFNRGAEGLYLARFAIDATAAVYVAYQDVQLRFIQPRKESRSHAEHHA